MKTILITGSNGFIATNFYNKFAHKYKFILLSQKTQKNHITWEQLISDISLIKTIDIVINLAGANIANNRWTTKRKKELLTSRLDTTKQLVEIFNNHNSNIHFISASAVGIYDFNSTNDENTIIDYHSYKNFSQQLTKSWEQEALKFHGLLTITRFGVVLSSKGGAMSKILPPVLFGLGGYFGNGLQGFPWIALADLLNALDFIIDKQYGGIFNLVALQHIDNKQLIKSTGKIWHRLTFMRIPAIIIRLLWGQMGEELLLNGNQVIPKHLLDSGFKFIFPNILDCLKAIKNGTC